PCPSGSSPHAGELACSCLPSVVRLRATHYHQTRPIRRNSCRPAWLDALEPITDVFPMGGVHTTLRRLVVDGVPVVTGLTAIGDSVCTTNPTFGRGLGVALWRAVDLREIIDAHGDDWSALAVAADERVADHVVPFHE